MKKIILSIITLFLICNIIYAKPINNKLENIIKDSKVDKNQISLSIKDANSGKVLYEINEKMLIPPASVQKMLTIIPIVNTLGLDYQFTTKLYSNNDNSIYLIKLGADPYLKTNDLKKLLRSVKPNIKKMLIDDSIVENKDWGEGWQWDDSFNPLMPRFNAYNLDNNKIKLSLFPIENETTVNIMNTSEYPLAIINELKVGNKNSFKFYKDKTFADNMIKFVGTINKQNTIYIPIENLNRYFNIKLNKCLEEKNIYLMNDFEIVKLQDDYKYENEISHSLNTAIKDVLKNSNNTISEISLKLAGAKANETTGSDKNGIELFYSYCNQIGLDTSNIIITDASGVSKNNLMNADFITEFLVKNKDNQIYDNLPIPGEGTLANRMNTLKNNLRAKTGTLSNISTIAGFLTTKKQNDLVFCIMTNSPSATIADLKILEDYIIRELYLRF